MSEPDSNNGVHCVDVPVGGGARMRRILLDRPQTLNALNSESVARLRNCIDEAEADSSVVCIWLASASPKAFCAGGDVVALRERVLVGDVATAATFFATEYALNHRLHTLRTPLLSWVDGACMGGGLGLSVAGSHRVVTPNAMLSMPEITIGLFPDVGASWFLSRLSERLGLFAGLTAARLNAADAVLLGLADYCVAADSCEAIEWALIENTAWQDPHGVIANVMLAHARDDASLVASSNIARCRDRLRALMSATDIEILGARLASADAGNDDWLAACLQAFRCGSPLSARLFDAQLRRARHASLAQCLYTEFAMATRCVREGDFVEGVRALLVDKDRAPVWQYDSIAEIPPAVVDAYFEAGVPVPAALADLSDAPTARIDPQFLP